MKWHNVGIALGFIGIFAFIFFGAPALFIWSINLGTYPTGVLVSLGGAPIQGLNIHAIQLTWDGKVIEKAQGPTNEQGFFTFPGKPAINYVISFSFKGTEFSKILPGGAIWDAKIPIVWLIQDP